MDLTRWPEYWKKLRAALLEPAVDEVALAEALRDARARMPVPVLWLLGKTQAGKTSIIRALTGSAAAEIGNGFRPCTRTARLYDFPAEAPIVRFLDTRGLGEVAYDPDEDIRFCEAQAHLVVAVMKVADADQTPVFEVLQTLRRRHPHWPVLVVQTGLHELYPPGAGHLQPWPYGDDRAWGRVPPDLRRALAAQRQALGALAGAAPLRWVAVDLTLAEDGFEPPDYGLDALWTEIDALARWGLRALLAGDESVRDLYASTAHRHIVGHAVAAAGLGALPAVDLVAVSAVQAKLLHALAALYGQRWERRMATEFVGLVGAGVASGFLARMLGRSAVKFIPFWGQTVGALWGASSAGASTYALGKAAVYFLGRRRDGLAVDAEALRAVYAEALERGAAVLRERLGGGVQ